MHSPLTVGLSAQVLRGVPAADRCQCKAGGADKGKRAGKWWPW